MKNVLINQTVLEPCVHWYTKAKVDAYNMDEHKTLLCSQWHKIGCGFTDLR